MRVAGKADFLLPIRQPLLRKENGLERRLVIEADHNYAPSPSEEEGAPDPVPGALIDHIRAEEAKNRHGGVADQ
jgi:hypothetical protein